MGYGDGFGVTGTSMGLQRSMLRCWGQRWGPGMDLGSLGRCWGQHWGHWDRFGVADVNVELLGWIWGHWDQFGVAEVNVDVLGSTLGSWDGSGVTGTGLGLQMSMFRV